MDTNVDVDSFEERRAASRRIGASMLSGKMPEVDLNEIFRTIWRRKKILIGTILLIMSAAFVSVHQLTPRYVSVAQVMIDPRQNQVVDIQSVISGLPQDLETIESEIEIIKSRRLAENVIKRLRLYDDPEFNPGLRKTAEWRKYLQISRYLPDSILEMIQPPQKSVLSEEQKQDRLRVQIVNSFLAHLDIDRKGRSRVIEIRYESEQAGLSTRIANTLADVYIVDQLEAKFEATKRATEWLNERVSKLRKAVTDSERAVETYRKQSGLLRGRGVTLATQQISELNSQLIVARTKRAEAEARLSQVLNLLRTSGGVDSAAEVLSSPLIQRLRGQEAQTLRRAAELSQEFGDKHPKMINARAELADLRKKIKSEVDKIVQNLRNEVGVALARERTLKSNLDSLEARVGNLNTSEVQLRALEREAEANRALYKTFLSRFKETGQQAEIQQADARIISRADVPTAPAFPKKNLLYAVAFAGASLLGMMLIFLIEKLDRGFRSMTQIETSTGIAAIGLIPHLGGMKSINSTPYDYVISKPSSAFGESLRSLYTSILLSNVDKPPKTVLITSSVPNEGKTSISISLARQVAKQSQKQVVLIDGDLRRPQVHRSLGLPVAPGLVEYLSGNASIEEILHRDDASGAIVITAGGIPNNPTDILASDQMRRLVTMLAETNDLVFIDSPPVHVVSDPKVLAQLADKTIYVVRWAETRREVVLTGLKQIVDVGTDIAGVVLSMVNVRRHSQYGYGDSGYYYGRSRKYYTR